MIFAQAYFIIGALILLGVMSKEQTWPKPLTVVIVLIFWPIPVVWAIRELFK